MYFCLVILLSVNQNFSDAARRWRALSQNIDQEKGALAGNRQINKLLDEFGINRIAKRAINPAFQHLTEKGVAELGALLRPEQTLDIKAHLQSCPTYGAHVAAQSNGLALEGNASEFACYSLPDIAATPHVIEIANTRRLFLWRNGIWDAFQHLSLNIWYLASPGMRHPNNAKYHRDIDDYKFLSLLLSPDVTMETGPHQYAIGTHKRGFGKNISQSLNLEIPVN